MIKRIVSSIICLAAIYPAISIANLDKYYIGADMQSIWLKPKNFTSQSDARWGLSGFAGYRWGVVALEFGVTGMQTQNYNYIGANQYNYIGRSRAFNVYIDALFFKTIAKNLELKGLIGSGLLNIKNSMYAYNSNNQFRFGSIVSGFNVGARLGAGLQYNITRHLSTSLMYKFQATSDEFSNMQALALSIAYMF